MKKNALLLGVAVSGMMLASACTSADKMAGNAEKAEVVGECHGVNACKGTGDCGGKSNGKGHSCAGKNSCKGKGWKKMSKKACLDKKGTFKKH